MFELIFTLIGGILYAAWWLLTKIWPVLLAGFIFFITIGIGASLQESIADGPLNGRMDDYTHTVTICWDEDGNDSDTYYVREDLNWALDNYSLSNSRNTSTSLFYEKNYDTIELPYKTQRSGKVFLGLFSSPHGIEQYVDRNGYSLRNVKSDITLYAIWADAQ